MKKVYIIAEIGVNHNGDINIAKKMIDKAVESGVDAVKFQTFKAENLVTYNAKQAEYQIKNLNKQTSQYEMLKKLELTYEEFKELKIYCDNKNIDFLSSPFDLESIDFLNKLNMKYYKIPSGEIENVPYLRKISSVAENIILSTGMSTLEDIEFALKILSEKVHKDNITVLHCNTNYPTKMEEVNLLAMNTIKEKFEVKVGYSDHTEGIEVAIASVALGAEIIEKHVTLDKNMSGPDHKASIDFEELKNMVKAIRNIEIALGSKYKEPTKSELKNIMAARKSIVAKKNILKGEIFTEDNIIIKRPYGGISPKKWDDIINKKAERNYNKDEMI